MVHLTCGNRWYDKYGVSYILCEVLLVAEDITGNIGRRHVILGALAMGYWSCYASEYDVILGVVENCVSFYAVSLCWTDRMLSLYCYVVKIG